MHAKHTRDAYQASAVCTMLLLHRFFTKIDWTVGEFNNYRKWPMDFKYTLDAPKGHLPLTNCLRGTQLFKALLEHPAFAKRSDGSAPGSTPDWMK